MAVVWIAGIDIGSVTAKAVVLRDGVVAASAVIRSGGDYRKAAETVLEAALAKAGVSRSGLSKIAVTGSGAANFPYEARRQREGRP